MVYSRNYEGAALTPRAEEPQSTVEPREREEPREPTTCASRAGRLIRSRATRHASGRRLIVDAMNPESTQFFFQLMNQLKSCGMQACCHRVEVVILRVRRIMDA